MLPLREATLHNHKKAEQMTFNVKMFKGELSEAQYLTYLCPKRQSIQYILFANRVFYLEFWIPCILIDSLGIYFP